MAVIALDLFGCIAAGELHPTASIATFDKQFGDIICSRKIQSSTSLRLVMIDGLDVSDSSSGNVRPRTMRPPGQALLVTCQREAVKFP
jgi:hypothetical protein